MFAAAAALSAGCAAVAPQPQLPGALLQLAPVSFNPCCFAVDRSGSLIVDDHVARYAILYFFSLSESWLNCGEAGAKCAQQKRKAERFQLARTARGHKKTAQAPGCAAEEEMLGQGMNNGSP